MKTSLRRRLTVALVGMAVGSLVLAVAVTAGLARSTARDDTARDLADAAEGITRLAGAEQLANLSRRLSRVLDVDDAFVVRIRPDGTPDPRSVPPGFDAAGIDGAALRSGRAQTGTDGRTVFVAQPVEGLAPRLERAGARTAIVLTRNVAVFPLGRGGPFLLVAAGLVAAVAAAVAVVGSRRLTRPIDAVQRAARAIAAGDLSARVGPDVAASGDELGALAATIDAMAADLERSRAAERVFLMSVSHDLRTPLTSIRGYAEAIGDGAVEGDDARRAAAAVIGSEAARLERLVSDLLDLARLDTRQFTLRPRPTDVAALATAATESFAPAAADAGITLTCRRPEEGVVADLDPDRVAQILANLIENALKYASTAVAVEVTAEGALKVPPVAGPDAAPVVIRVTDDGGGIAPGDLDRVFERLYVARDNPGRKLGTGLGLAIVAELVSAMGGTVAARNLGEGGGTRFQVSLPRPPTRPSSHSGAVPTSSWSSPAGARSSSSSTPGPRSRGL